MECDGPYMAHTWEWYGKVKSHYGNDTVVNFGNLFAIYKIVNKLSCTCMQIHEAKTHINKNYYECTKPNSRIFSIQNTTLSPG